MPSWSTNVSQMLSSAQNGPPRAKPSVLRPTPIGGSTPCCAVTVAHGHSFHIFAHWGRSGSPLISVQHRSNRTSAQSSALTRLKAVHQPGSRVSPSTSRNTAPQISTQSCVSQAPSKESGQSVCSSHGSPAFPPPRHWPQNSSSGWPAPSSHDRPRLGPSLQTKLLSS